MKNVVIITGMSGAGKTLALKCIEDIGYYAIDNLPASLLIDMVNMMEMNPEKFGKIAAVMDVRGGRSFDELFDALDELKKKGVDYFILFLDASDNVLVRRFSETRRLHPLESEGLRIADTISRERKILERLHEKAHVVIDTSYLNVYQLRETLRGIITSETEEKKISVTVVSFGYKFGIPLDADLIMDLRFIPNPYWIEELRQLSGLDEEVVGYVMGFSEAREFLQQFSHMLLMLLPLYRREQKPHLSIGFGCTGGRHRSVVIAEEIRRILEEKGYTVNLFHRDLDRK